MALNTSAASTSDAIETALATLLPLRDLSRNWDVDIASCLQEYLHELTGIHNLEPQEQHPSDPSKQNGSSAAPNFAHAALILQNSSNVYGRKVEYLHGLVYKALNEFFKATSANGSKEARRKSQDPAIEEFFDFDPYVDFMLLDDVVPEDLTNKKINLKEEDEDEELGIDLGGSSPNHSLTRTRLSLGGLSVTRAENRSSLAGLGSSAQQRALLGTLNNGSLRLVEGLCDMGDDGVMIMPGSQTSRPSITMVDQAASGGRRSLFGDEAVPISPQLQQADDYDDHSNNGPGFEFHDDGYDDPEPVGLEEEAPAKVVAVPMQQQQQRQQMASKKVTFQEPKKRADPWALLDPHYSEKTTQKPLRKGKTYRLPPGVDLPPSECVTGASTRRMPKRQPPPAQQEARLCLTAETFRALLRNQWEPPKIPMNGLVFGDEFAYIAKETAKKRAVLRREERKRQKQEQSHTYVENEIDDDEEDDYGGGFDFGGEDDYDNDDNNEVGNAGMTSLDDAFKNATDNQDISESNLGKTFEELCRAHIQAFAKGAEDYALNTQLTDRVGKWQAKLAPILEEEEKRAAFDILEYSKRIIETAQQGLQRIKRKSDGSTHAASKTVDFESVTKDCSRSDVCRMFLASLSLANAGNLQIVEGASNYRFDLLSVNVELPMETYQAPSLIDGV